jgi:15-cis-phytoene synthase
MTTLASADIETSYLACRNTTKAHAKAFFFASFALPRDKRYAAYSVYTFCRRADNLVDDGGHHPDVALVRAGIESMRAELDRVFGDLPPAAGDIPAFRHTVRAYGIPREYFLDLLRGVEMDLDRDRYDTFEELREYCYCVASVVGLIMTRILGTTDDAALGAAADLGTAMQLTNILRDVGEDRHLGRVYLPMEDLDRFRYTEGDLARGVINENFVELMQFQVERAREYYRRSESGIPMLGDPSARRTVRIMGRSYRQILEKIEQNRFDVFTRRAFVPLAEKLLIAAGSFLPGPGERLPLSPGGAIEQHAHALHNAGAVMPGADRR